MYRRRIRKRYKKTPPRRRRRETKENARNATREKSIGRTARRDRRKKPGTRTGHGNHERQREKAAQIDKAHEQEAIRLREKRRSQANDIAMKKAKTSGNKAAPTPAPKTKAPTLNLLDSPTKSVQISQDVENRCIPGEEGRENIQPRKIDLSKPEQSPGPRNPPKLAIAGFKDELEGRRYIKNKEAPRHLR